MAKRLQRKTHKSGAGRIAVALSLIFHGIIALFLVADFVMERVQRLEAEAPVVIARVPEPRKLKVKRRVLAPPKTTNVARTTAQAAEPQFAPTTAVEVPAVDSGGLVAGTSVFDADIGNANVAKPSRKVEAFEDTARPPLQSLAISPPMIESTGSLNERTTLAEIRALPLASPRTRADSPREVSRDAASFARSTHQAAKPGEKSISGADIARLPGTTGDALKALRSMPGIVTAGDLSGELFVRGGSSDENRFYFDRLLLGYPYHFGGLVSTISSDLIDRVDVHAGGFGAEFGEAQAIIEIVPKRLNRDQLVFNTNLNPLMSEWFVSSPVAGNGSAYFAGRRSYADLIIPKIVTIEQITAFPRFWDYQAGAEIDLSPTQNLRLAGFAANDFMQLLLKQEDVSDDPEFAGDLRYRYGFSGRGATLESLLGDRGRLESTVAQNNFDIDFSFGDGFFLRIDQKFWNAREDLIYRLSDHHRIEAGAEAFTGNADISSFFVRPPEEGDPARADFGNQEKIDGDVATRLTWLSAYAKDTISLSERLALTLGARFQHFNVTGTATVDPRVSAAYAPRDDTTLRVSWGIYRQSPEPYHIILPWGNPDAESRRAAHFVFEAERRFAEVLSVKLAAYQKRLDNLITSDPVQIYLNQGEGVARGAELFGKYNPSERLIGWVSYAYGRSTRRDRPDEPERLFSYDQTHVATLAASYLPNRKWELGFKWQYATGTPYTPVLGAELVQRDDDAYEYAPIYGETNSDRLPPYHRLDVRIARTWNVGGAEFVSYLEILNAYYRKNILQLDYNDDYSEEEPIYQLPIIPYIGFTARF